MLSIYLAVSLMMVFLTTQGMSNPRAHRLLQDYCPNATINYTLHIIDGYVKGIHPGCSYRYIINSGNCTLTTPFVQETSPGYVCFSQNSGFCTPDFRSIIGIATIRCNNVDLNKSISAIPVVALTQEFNLTTDFLDGKAVFGYTCSVPVVQSSLWLLRKCTTPVSQPAQPIQQQPQPAKSGFSYGLQISFGLFLLLIFLLF